MEGEGDPAAVRRGSANRMKIGGESEKRKKDRKTERKKTRAKKNKV